LEAWFLSPVHGKPIQKGWIPLVATEFQEFSFKVFVQGLEEGKQGSSRYTIERDPQLVA